MLKKYRDRVLDVCFRRPGNYCRAAWEDFDVNAFSNSAA